MNKKRSIFVKAIIIAAVVALLFATIPALASSKDYKMVKGTIELQKQGFYVAVPGVKTTTLTIEKSANPFIKGLNTRTPALDIKFKDSRGHVIKPEGVVAVYFNLGPLEKSVWDMKGAKRISIYVRGTSGTWEKCPTYWVKAGPIGSRVGPEGRLACHVTKNGTYALATDMHNVEYNNPEKP